VRVDREREQELATTVQVKRRKLLCLLTPEEQRTQRRTHGGSGDPETFEDAAREISEHVASPRSGPVGEALAEFQAAVGALWTHAQETDLPGFLAVTWRQKHRGYAWLDRTSVECEVLFNLRRFIVRFEPDGGNLVDYCRRGVHQHLTEWAASQGALEVPRKEGRKTGPSAIQKSLSHSGSNAEARNPQYENPCPDLDFSMDIRGSREIGEEAAGLVSDPWPLIDAAIDGEITEEDL
jgi:hypothetical protein